MNFIKMEATGNDFILIDARGREEDWNQLSRDMCDRNFGIGADGLLLTLSSETADFRMRIFNADGSEAEMCGNGIRCLIKYIVEHISGDFSHRKLSIETAAGIIIAVPDVVNERVNSVQAVMGTPQWKRSDLQLSVTDKTGNEIDITSVVSCNTRIQDKELSLKLISMGNPHAVCFVDEPVQSFPLSEIGPMVENSPVFPERTNFEVVNVLERHKLKARVWERGVGETLSCGTGACAIAAASRLCGYSDNKVDITLPGGVLSTEWDGVGTIQLSGPVREVFSGEWD
jgi:diaminopimelate epimerase